MNHLQNDLNLNSKNTSNKKNSSNNKTSNSSTKPKKTISSTHASTVNTSLFHNSNSNDDNKDDSDKEKHKLYAGISSKFVKCAWEQIDKGDIDVNQDVFSKLSEDVTYKLWEVANNIKTYARHCGGVVTTSLVNDVLKDSNVPPVLGCDNSQWDKIELDRSYFFQTDSIISLSDEYSKEINQNDDCVELSLTTSWSNTHNNKIKDLQDFCEKLCNAIFIGFEDSIQIALDLAASEPNINCLLKQIFKNISDQLLDDFSNDLLERCLKFLNAVANNPYTRDSFIDVELITISEILICILVGPKPINEKEFEDKKRMKYDNEFLAKLKTQHIVDVLEDNYTGLYSPYEDPPILIRNPLSKIEKPKSETIKTEDTKDDIKPVVEVKSEFDQTNQFCSNKVSQEESSLSQTTLQNDIIMDVDSYQSDQQMSNNSNQDIIQQINQQEGNEIEDPDFTNFKNECEELFALMEEIRNSNQTITVQNDFSIKNEKAPKIKPEDRYDNELVNNESINIQNINLLQVKKEPEILKPMNNIKMETNHQFHHNIKREKETGEDDYIFQFDTNIESNDHDENEQKFINKRSQSASPPQPFRNYLKTYTNMCTSDMILSVASTIGVMSSKWGYFENIALLILKARMKRFFRKKKSCWNKANCDWLIRIIYGLWAVGEEGIGEFFYYTKYIDPNVMPKWSYCHLNIAAVFLRGKSHKDIYEWLYQVCGDSILPNMIYFSKQLEKLSEKQIVYKKLDTYRIIPKLYLKTINKVTTRCNENLQPFLINDSKIEKKNIIWKYSGCRINNAKFKKIVKIEKLETKLNETNLFNQKIVIGKRKIMTVYTNEYKPKKFVHISNYNL